MCLKNIGIVHYNQGQFLQSLEYNEQALAIFDSLHDKNGSANMLNNIGSIYIDQGDNMKALSYFLKSLKLSEEIGNKLRTATALGNIGISLFSKTIYHRKSYLVLPKILFTLKRNKKYLSHWYQLS